jgi:hypothetical protein
MLSLRLIIVCLILPLVVNAGNPEDYRFPREPGTTEDGFPLALSGVPITKTPVIANPGVKVKASRSKTTRSTTFQAEKPFLMTR